MLVNLGSNLFCRSAIWQGGQILLLTFLEVAIVAMSDNVSSEKMQLGGNTMREGCGSINWK